MTRRTVKLKVSCDLCPVILVRRRHVGGEFIAFLPCSNEKLVGNKVIAKRWRFISAAFDLFTSPISSSGQATWLIYGLALLYSHNKKRPALGKFVDDVLPLVSDTWNSSPYLCEMPLHVLHLLMSAWCYLFFLEESHITSLNIYKLIKSSKMYLIDISTRLRTIKSRVFAHAGDLDCTNLI